MKVYLPIADRRKRERERINPVPPRREPEPKADQDEPMAVRSFSTCSKMTIPSSFGLSPSGDFPTRVCYKIS